MSITRSIAALAMSLSACATNSASRDGASREAIARDYAPLDVGASWTYSMSYPGQKGEMTVTIIDQKDGYFRDDKQSELRHTPEGLRDRQRYLIHHPLKAGGTWKTIVSASAIENYSILSVGDRCESMAGSFPDCLVIESSVRGNKNVTLYIRWTWAKDIGLVKLETEVDVAGKGRLPQVKQSLLRYALKGARAPTGASNGQTQDEPDAPTSWER